MVGRLEYLKVVSLWVAGEVRWAGAGGGGVAGRLQKVWARGVAGRVEWQKQVGGQGKGGGERWERRCGSEGTMAGGGEVVVAGEGCWKVVWQGGYNGRKKRSGGRQGAIHKARRCAGG